MKKRKLEHKNVILALALTTLVFILGIFLGDILVSEKYDQVASTISELQVKTISMELEFELLLENPCLNNSFYLLDELNLLSERLGYLEEVYGVDYPEILTLKKYYSLLLIRHWIYIKKLNEECGLENNHILYFYSNEDCKDCEIQGKVLTAFRKSNPNSTFVYPYDYNIDDPSLNALKRIYSINQTPSVVYNGRVLPGFTSLTRLKEVFSE